MDRFDVRDLTKKKRDSQDASFCTSMTTALPIPVRTSVCRFIAHRVVNLPHWKRELEELSWMDDAKAKYLHEAYERKQHGSS
jgi:hypothetical protein